MTDDQGVERYLPISEPVYHILLALSDGARHGYGVLLDVERRTGGAVRLGTGTLYSIVKRLRESGLIEEVPAPEDSEDQRRKFYAMTELGRRVVRSEALRHARLAELAREQGVLPA